MATTSRRRTNRAKSSQKKNYSLTKWIVFSLLFIATFIYVYAKKDELLYYFGLKVYKGRLSEKEQKIENKRIASIVNDHENKTFGIDVSQYQGNIKWDILEAPDELFEIKFVVVRATAGATKVDRKFKKNWKALTARPYLQGAYHYYRPDENSTLQANNFINTVHLRKGHIPPILDIEKMPKGQSINRLKEGLKNWLSIVEKHYKVKPIIYTGEKFYEDFLKDDFSDYKFWIANYNPWKKQINANFLMWQFSEKAVLIGVDENVDVNVFNGSVADLKAICLD